MTDSFFFLIRKKEIQFEHLFISITMSNMNTNGRSLRDQFQQQQQKHDIQFECIHCGRHQTISLLSQSKITKGVCVLFIYISKIKDLCSSSTCRSIKKYESMPLSAEFIHILIDITRIN
jgi:transcription elongation factor Elf1